MVRTVSRCIMARLRGMSTATTTRACPDANSRRASSSTADGVVRSPIPISTTPGARTSRSPPSSVAGR